MQGFQAVQFVINYASHGSAGATGAPIIRFYLEHNTASALGVGGTWSLVPLSQYIHSVIGGYTATDSGTAATGIHISGQALTSNIMFFGYKADNSHRYIRLGMSISGTPSTMWMGAICLLGGAANWAVNTPV